MATLNEVLLLTSLSLLGITTGTRDLSASYPFKATLNTEKNGGLYELYWTFDNAEETIFFAVRVQTEGWIGFGLSPNGKMPGSDVVIGWVDGNGVFLHVSNVWGEVLKSDLFAMAQLLDSIRTRVKCLRSNYFFHQLVYFLCNTFSN